MNLCVYCGAADIVDKKFKDLAYDVGSYMAKNNLDLVYGGGCFGLMGNVSQGVVDHGGRAIGYIPQHLIDKEGENKNIHELHVVDSMHIRKEKMAQKADAFLILPGGFGTLDEFFEIMTWKQLALHNKPIIIFNAFHYWDSLIALANKIIEEKFAQKKHLELFSVVQSTDEIASLLSVK